MKNAETSTVASKSLVKRGTESLGVALDALDAAIRDAAKQIADAAGSKKKADRESTAARANHLVGLGVKMAQIVAELRKVEHAEARAANEVSPRALLEYFRRLGPEQRAKWARDLQAMDRKGGVFG